MKANEKYLNWLEGPLRETIDKTLKEVFRDIQIENGESRKTLMSLIDGFIKNQLDISEGKRC